MGIALPNKEKGESVVTNRILPMFRETAVLRGIMTDRADVLKAVLQERGEWTT